MAFLSGLLEGRINTNKATGGLWEGQFADKRKASLVVWVKAEVGGILNNLVLLWSSPKPRG